MTPEQRELARHALGLPNGRRRSYRNHFVCGSGNADHDHWMLMVSIGEAARRKGCSLTGGDDLFRLTVMGARAALDNGEKLCSKDFPAEGTSLKNGAVF